MKPHTNQYDKIELEARKHKIQAAFWNDMGLHVDKSRQWRKYGKAGILQPKIIVRYIRNKS